MKPGYSGLLEETARDGGGSSSAVPFNARNLFCRTFGQTAQADLIAAYPGGRINKNSAYKAMIVDVIPLIVKLGPSDAEV